MDFPVHRSANFAARIANLNQQAPAPMPAGPAVAGVVSNATFDGKHISLTDKEVATVIDHADGSVTDAKLATPVGAGASNIFKTPASATSGYVLAWNGSAWVATAPTAAASKDRHIWTPVNGYDVGGTNTPLAACTGNWAGAYLSAVGDHAKMGLMLPEEFSTLISAYIIVECQCTNAAAAWSIYLNCDSIMSSAGTRSASDTASTYSAATSAQNEGQ